MRRHLLPLAALVAVGTLPPAAATAQGAPRRIELEVRDGPAGQNVDPVRISVPVPGPSASTVETRIGPARYRVTIQRERRDAAHTRLHFDIHRIDPRDEGIRDVSLSVSVLVRPGHRATLARFDRPDGTRTAITARLR